MREGVEEEPEEREEPEEVRPQQHYGGAADGKDGAFVRDALK